MSELAERDDAAESRRLDLLISDYEMAREDERSLLTVQAATISVATALLGALPVVLQQTCAFDARQGCYPIPEPVIAATPLIPLAVLGFLLAMGMLSIIRSYYLRILEDELQQYSGRPFRFGQIQPASYMSLQNEVTSLKRGRSGFRILVALVLVAAVLIFVGLSLYIGLKMSGPTQLVMAAVLVPAVGFMLTQLWTIFTHGRGFFVSVCESYLAHRHPHALPRVMTARAPVTRRARSMTSYLLLPRPDDLVKSLVAPAVLLLTIFPDWTLDAFWKFLALWLVFELLVYQARYQWNDIRGFKADASHPERDNKARLPLSDSKSVRQRVVRTSTGVIFAKIGAALLLATFFHQFLLMCALVGVTVVSAIAYEFVRSREPEGPAWRDWVLATATWLIVTIGYALRAAIGLVPTEVSPIGGTGQLLIWTLAAFGGMVVAMIWAMEGASFCKGTLETNWRATKDLTARPHIALLLRQTATPPALPAVAEPPDSDAGNERVLAKRGALAATWNLFGLFAIVLAGLVVVELPWAARFAHYQALLSITLVLAFLALVACASQWQRVVVLGVIPLVGAVESLVLDDWSHLLFLGIPTVIVGGTYVALRNSSFRDFRVGAKNTLKWIVGSVGKLAVLFVGKQTAKYIGLSAPDQNLPSF